MFPLAASMPQSRGATCLGPPTQTETHVAHGLDGPGSAAKNKKRGARTGGAQGRMVNIQGGCDPPQPWMRPPFRKAPAPDSPRAR